MRECREPQSHKDSIGACERCHLLICTICNQGNRCYGECGASPMKATFETRVFEEFDTRAFDSLGLPERAIPLYGLIEDVEVAEGRDDEKFYAIVFFVVKARWMDELNVKKITPEHWSTAADESEAARIHIG